jgi:chemotaxis protein histidine kinase CheA
LSDLRSRLSALAEEFRRGAPERLAGATAALEELRHDPADASARERVFRVFHSLAGSGGTHGMPEVSRLGLAGETLLRKVGAGPFPEEALDEAEGLLDALRAQFED